MHTTLIMIMNMIININTMPNTSPATAVVAWTGLPRHLGLAADVFG